MVNLLFAAASVAVYAANANGTVCLLVRAPAAACCCLWPFGSLPLLLRQPLSLLRLGRQVYIGWNCSMQLRWFMGLALGPGS